MFDRWNALDQKLGQGNLMLSRVGETGSTMKQICNRIGNGKKTVSVYQRREIIIQVKEVIAVDVDEVGPSPREM